jgi:hypothetical protein
MRHHLVKLAPAFLVGGCSLIYNPNNIKPPADAPIDMRPPIDMEIVADADPTMLQLDSAYPPDVYEGVGTGGGRPAVVVIYGHNIAQDAQAALMPTGTANVTILEQHVAHDGNFLMLALQGPIDTMTGQGTDVPIAITVTQSSSAGPIVKSIDAALTYHYLDELTDANVGTDSDAVSAKTWSMVELQNAVTFAAAHGPVLIRAMSSINVVTINANAGTAPAAGPGGCAGGDGGTAVVVTAPPTSGACAGGGHAGGAGGGAGFFTMGGNGTGTGSGGPIVGEKQITSYAANPASGGGGGAAAVAGDGGAGGGGGGVVELTARGDVTVTAINANGGAGGGSGGVASPGGGGAGGLILVRAGGTLTGPAMLSAVKGVKGGTNAGDGSDGRTRYDAAMIAGTVTGTNAYHGPMWTAPDLFAMVQTPTLTLTGEALDVDDVRVFTKDGDINDTADANFGTNGNAMVHPQLRAGYSKVCVTVKNGQPLPATPESTNCIEVAFLP